MSPNHDCDLETPASGTETPGDCDTIADLPTRIEMTAAATGEAFHQHPHPHEYPGNFQESHQDTNVSEEPTENDRDQLKRRGSSASHVAVDHFDPEGVNELRRTLTQQSGALSITSVGVLPAHEQPTGMPRSAGESTVVSEFGGGEESEKFDFEQILKDSVRLWVFSLTIPEG